MAGKHYNKGMRAHKLTVQALWRLLLPHFLQYTQQHSDEVYQVLIPYFDEGSDVNELITFCQSDRFQVMMASFITPKADTDAPNFQFWGHYMEMVSILLTFTRAQREGN